MKSKIIAVASMLSLHLLSCSGISFLEKQESKPDSQYVSAATDFNWDDPDMISMANEPSQIIHTKNSIVPAEYH
ncbi:MAG: hypothetical protein AAFV07_18065, partial [Bacteroidota bacterium]